MQKNERETEREIKREKEQDKERNETHKVSINKEETGPGLKTERETHLKMV